MYALEEKKLIEEIIKHDAKRILIQLPEGLKKDGFKLANIIKKKTNSTVIVSGDACYGGCDLALNEAKEFNIDLLVHYGHTSFIVTNFPVIYFEARYSGNIKKTMRKALLLLKDFRKIALAATIQHIHQLKNAKAILESHRKKVLIVPKRGHAVYNGQILGCDYKPMKYISHKVDAFILIGSRFHALGAALAVNKPVVLVDLYAERVEEMSKLKNKILRQRCATIHEAKDAYKFGIIIGLKEGQKNFKLASIIKKMLEKAGKEVVFICMREISPENLISFQNIEAFVDTACPRVAIDDIAKFNKPIITPEETLVMLGKKSWGNLCEKGWF